MPDFLSDFEFVLYVARKLDLEYGRASAEFPHDLHKFKSVIANWNKKYPDVLLALSDISMQVKVKIILLSERSELMEIINSLSKNVKVKYRGNELVIHYLNALGTERVAYLRELGAGRFELVYNYDMIKERSLEYRLCEVIALRKAASFQIQKPTFSFDTNEESEQGRGIGYLNTYRFFDK